MQAVIPDKRKKQVELPCQCQRCAFPEVQISTEKKPKTIAFVTEGVPKDEETALARGWVDSEMGLLCPFCAGLDKAESAEAAAEGAESHVGAAGMTNALAEGIAEVVGEEPPEHIKEEDLNLPIPHSIIISDEEGGVDENMLTQGSCTATCANCGQVWKVKIVNGDFITETPYVRNCTPNKEKKNV